MAGLRAALDCAAMGQDVTLIEKTPFLGGRTMQLGTVYPTDEPAVPLVRRLIDEVMSDERIEVRTYTRLTDLTGFLGDFSATLTTEPRGVDAELKDAAAAMEACPTIVDDEFNDGLSTRKAFYKPHPGSVPELPAIDWAVCTRCGECVLAAGSGIEIDGVPESEAIEVGAIIVATGYDHYEPREGEYGYRASERVITLPQLERMLDPDGPTCGQVLVEGVAPRSMAFIHCVGCSPDRRRGRARAGRACSTSTARACAARPRCRPPTRSAAALPDTAVYDLYRDIRTYQKEQEDYYVDASKLGVRFLRFDDETRDRSCRWTSPATTPSR